MKLFLVFSIIILSLFTASAQNEYTAALKNHFLVEDQYMVANTNSGIYLFPIHNNEFSIGYGINSFTELGIYHDYLEEPDGLKSFLNGTDRHIVGLRANISFFSLAKAIGLKKIPKRFEIVLSGYLRVYHQRFSRYAINHYDIKDNAKWANYSRVGFRYFIGKNLYMTATGGLYNTNRFFLGVGLKL
ncbi:MAG: hypothetical protein RBS73_05990 [Prolixibacteraceae bacterium]|jgi:hypothetical protein|nr:hypothetical protein [Prolixibacteraceae bacterium]